MKESAKTSIISKRWRYLWAMITRLDFNHLIILPESEPDAGNTYFFTAAHKDKYIKWVNQVVDLCLHFPSTCIDTFRVSFSRFDSSDSHHIDRWVRFALSKRVDNLELILFSLKTIYNLTLTLNLNLNLKSLHLNSINVSGDFLECLLARSHLLERLHVEKSQTLVRVKVVGCKLLKQLTIRKCDNLEEIEIDDDAVPNLTYFEYFGANRCSHVVFKGMSNLPMLDEAKFGLLSSIFHQISHVAAPLHISKLSLNLMFVKIPASLVFPTFCNLKQLTIQVVCEAGYEILGISQILKACPLLREFNVEITFRSPDDDADIDEAYELRKVDLSSSSDDDVHVERTRFDWEYFQRVLGIL